MPTTVYLIRHSEPLKNKINIINTDSLQTNNEKTPLSITGEKKAEKLSELEELQNIDIVISSNYVRAISTAKYIANKNNLDLNIMETFGERKHGITCWSELPEDFERRQLEEPTFKIGAGENQKEVATRMHNSLINVLSENKNKRIAIVSHATAITFLLIKLGDYKQGEVYFNEEKIINKDFCWNAPGIFRLTFSESNQLEEIKHIEFQA